jgi:hypothetical protein
MLSNKEFSDLVKTHNGRISIVDISHSFVKDNFQRNKTPMDIIRKMCNKTSVFDKNILVLFNVEFLEHLVFECKIPAGNITFIADSNLEKTICKKLYGVYGVYSIVIPESNFKDQSFIKEIKEMGKKFDLCFSNPPYNSNVDLKIIRELEPICDEMVIVHPSTWAIDLKGKKKLYNDFKAQIEGKVKSVEMFNGNPIFGIGLFVPCMITHIDKGSSGDIEVKYFDDMFYEEDLYGVTKFGNEWTTIVKPFFEKIKDYVAKNGSIWDHNTFEIEDGKHYCQLAAIRGHVELKENTKIVQDDFYTMLMKDSDGNKGIRIDGFGKSKVPTFQFDTKNEQDNFISYLKTDFARFCLCFYKSSANLHRGELELVPWLDFTEEWDDEKLFKKFNVSQELQDYIREFLPDYHGIR